MIVHPGRISDCAEKDVLILVILGTILPYYFWIAFLIRDGMDFVGIKDQLLRSEMMTVFRMNTNVGG